MTSRAGAAPGPGYVMPAEWEPHASTWLSWPKDPLTFPPGVIERVEPVFAEVVRSLAKGERVDLLVDDGSAQKRVEGILGDSRGVRFHRIKTVDVWTRDYLPTFVRGNSVAAVKWRFNAWGDKYEELLPDDRAGMEVARASGLKVFEAQMVLEGGSIDVNGSGTCLTTEQCLLNKNRNPKMSREQIAARLRDLIGARNLVWLKRGIEGDDTDGHIDDIARFVSPSTVLCMAEEDEGDANFSALREDLHALEAARDQEGRPLKVITLPMPRKKVGGAERLPASYANFYIGNSVVLVPTFDDVNDERAIATLRGLFPSRKVLGLNCESLVYGFGGIHCVTQQQPA